MVTLRLWGNSWPPLPPTPPYNKRWTAHSASRLFQWFFTDDSPPSTSRLIGMHDNGWVHHTRQQQVDPPAALQKSTVVVDPGQKLRWKKSWLTTGKSSGQFPKWDISTQSLVWDDDREMYREVMWGQTTFTLKITSEQKKVDKEIHMEALTFVKVLGLLPNPFGLFFGIFPSVPLFCVKPPSLMLFPLFILVTCVYCFWHLVTLTSLLHAFIVIVIVSPRPLSNDPTRCSVPSVFPVSPVSGLPVTCSFLGINPKLYVQPSSTSSVIRALACSYLHM